MLTLSLRRHFYWFEQHPKSTVLIFDSQAVFGSAPLSVGELPDYAFTCFKEGNAGIAVT